MNMEFDELPKELDNIGKEVFLKVPFYKRNNPGEVIYINKELYEKLFGKKYQYERAKKDIIDRFSVTLDNTGEYLGEGFVDRQSDPTDIALNGNKGSGRAFYLYRNCNVKGTKTPLATSSRSDYNNGYYSLDSAIQEGLISNVLDKDLFDNFETLAIIDTGEKYLFPYVDRELPCGLIVRYYKDKQLYRFSHRFVNNKPFSKEEIIWIAHKIGELEGKKFIDRFIHGAWSIGNISIDGNMIDLDTSFFVEGRNPQWSYTDKYITNYFGYEEYGQIKALETVINSDLNIDKVSIDLVRKIICEKKKTTIRENFGRLLGYQEEVYLRYKEQFDELADMFCQMSKLIFDNYDNLNCSDINSLKTYLFNFSRLFRFYQIDKNELRLLINKEADCFSYIYDNEEYHKKIREMFNDIIVTDIKDYSEYIKQAISFISKMDELVALIDREENVDKKKKLVYAYVRNEDKKYLMAKKWMRSELIGLYHERGSKVVNDVMNMIIACYQDRYREKDSYMTDLYIADIGIIYREINVNGYYKNILRLYDDVPYDEIIVKINNQEVIFKRKNDVFESIAYENDTLREIDKVKIYFNNKYVDMIELGVDNIWKKYFTSCDNDDAIRMLHDEYNIDVTYIERMMGGTTECYQVYGKNGKYFLKIFEDGKKLDEVIREYKMLEILRENKIPVPQVIKNNDGKIGLICNGRVLMIQGFISGKTFHNSELSEDMLMESALLLGRMHQVLKKEYDVKRKDSLDREEVRKQIDYLLRKIDNIKDDENYELLKEILEYRKSKLDDVYEDMEMFNNITYGLSHNDYSKRQLIYNRGLYVVDFSSSDIVPLAWEVIRSFILSTEACKNGKPFDIELFEKYVDVYLQFLELTEDDIKAMPYLMMKQLVSSNYGFMEYINGQKEEIEYLKWKYEIELFLEEKMKMITDSLQKKYVRKR